MKRTTWIAVCTGALAAACLIGCVKAAENAGRNAPAAPQNTPAPATTGAAPVDDTPALPSDKPWQEWVEESPMRQKMRALWFDCGLIVGNSLYPEIADLGLLKLAADDIASKADGFARHWESVRGLNRQAANAANASDWQLARDKVNETELACEGCHMENWSFSTRGALPETLKGWRDNDTVFGNEPWGDMKLNGAPGWIAQMLQLRARVHAARLSTGRLDREALLGHTRYIHEFAHDQASRWRQIEAQAKVISRAAVSGALWEVQGQYLTMRRNCIECHDQLAPERGLAPMPWKG